jgi:hypothetical protein
MMGMMERSREEERVRVIINWGFVVYYNWLLAGPKVPVCSLDLLVTNPELFESHGRTMEEAPVPSSMEERARGFRRAGTLPTRS